MTRVRFENVVASASFGVDLDLRSIAAKLERAEYAPDRFPGLIYRLEQPKTVVLLFNSGKAVCAGGKSWAQANAALGSVSAVIRKFDRRILVHPTLKIENIVAIANLGMEMNLNAVVMALGLDRVEYEPEQFPGAVYRMVDPRVVMLLFKSGKVVCTGGRNPTDVGLGVEILTKDLRNAGLIGEERVRTALPTRSPHRSTPSPLVSQPAHSLETGVASEA